MAHEYWPTDTKDMLYIEGTITLQEVLDKVRDKFGNIDLSLITVYTENIHTDCLSYDLYDSSDYTLFTIIQRNI